MFIELALSYKIWQVVFLSFLSFDLALFASFLFSLLLTHFFLCQQQDI
jgi:hypothetical protein